MTIEYEDGEVGNGPEWNLQYQRQLVEVVQQHSATLKEIHLVDYVDDEENIRYPIDDLLQSLKVELAKKMIVPQLSQLAVDHGQEAENFHHCSRITLLIAQEEIQDFQEAETRILDRSLAWLGNAVGRVVVKRFEDWKSVVEWSNIWEGL